MKITIESTAKIVTLKTRDGEIPARVWQGETDSGIPVQCFITRIAPEIPVSDPDIEERTRQFEHELERQAPMRPTLEGIPLRMIN